MHRREGTGFGGPRRQHLPDTAEPGGQGEDGDAVAASLALGDRLSALLGQWAEQRDLVDGLQGGERARQVGPRPAVREEASHHPPQRRRHGAGESFEFGDARH